MIKTQLIDNFILTSETFKHADISSDFEGSDFSWFWVQTKYTN